MGRKNKQIDEINNRLPWKIGIYIRLSKDDGNLESESVINQKKILTEYLINYFEGEYNLIDFYIDDGLSGTDDTRADFMRMLDDIENKKVNCIICKNLSRAFRNYSDQGYYLEYYFPHKNIRFISTGDPKIDTFLNPEVITGLEVPITGLMNDRYAAKTSNDIRRTFDTKRRNGEFIGSFPPYGYLKSPNNKNKLILDDEIVPIKRDILHWIIDDGMSLNAIAKKLNELGVLNPTAYKQKKGWKYYNPKSNENDGYWTGTTVKRVMLNKVNIGHMIQGKQKVISYKVHDKISVKESDWFIKENTHEPTFSQEEYDKLEKILNKDTRTGNGKNTLHLFSGFLKCIDCNKALHRKTSKNIVYYTCRTYSEKSKTKCTKHSIRLDLLEKSVLLSIQIQISLIESISKILKNINDSSFHNKKTNRLQNEIDSKNKELEKINKLSDGLYIDWKSGNISYEEYIRIKNTLHIQKNSINKNIVNLVNEKNIILNNLIKGNDFLNNFIKYKNIKTLDRSLLTHFIDTIYVHEGKEITIKFLFQDEFKRVLSFLN